MAKQAPSRLDNVISLAKRRGFVFPVVRFMAELVPLGITARWALN